MPRTKVVKKSIGSVDQFRTLETMLRRKGVQNPIAPLVGTRKPAELKVRNPVSLGVRNPAALRDYIERTKTGKKRFLTRRFGTDASNDTSEDADKNAYPRSCAWAYARSRAFLST